MQTQKWKKECAGLFIALSLCNFGLSHVGDQTTKTFFSPEFVYSVIINQSPDTTVFWVQGDKQKLWRSCSGKRTEKEKTGAWKAGSHRNRK